MNITFFFMTQKAYDCLPVIKRLNKTVNPLVVIGQDPSVENDYSKGMVSYCEEHNIAYCLKQDYPNDNQAEYAVAIGWRWMLTNLDCELIVFHDSLLPKYRGFNPLVSALINGEPEVGVTALKANLEFDAGDIVGQQSVHISYPIKIQQAITLVSRCYQDLLDRVLISMLNENLSYQAQDTSLATYSVWRDERDYQINWSDDARKIARFVDAIGYPYKGAQTTINGEPCHITDVEVVEPFKVENRVAGKVMFIKAGQPVVLCGNGAIKIINGHYEDQRPLVPLEKFRSRFGDEK
ncbi:MULTISPECIES: methionyl-tRNA formyltransferase [unclassified Agarivorans]|uniref:methionyl-tRNA formyltransferase n=1 Tax=unclassified Agarivorans TaxID=2636026 RepID=UPI003D7DE3A4